MALFNQIIEAQLRFQEQLLARKNVVGVGVGYKESKGERTDEMVLVAMVEKKKKKEELTEEDLIPSDLEGMKTDVYEVGFIEALDSPQGRFRPTIPPGVSIGHPDVTAGTLGAIVKDRATGDRLILSNNHVLAACNDARIGDPILQPGPLDGGAKPADIVAKLERFIKLYYVDDPVPTPPDPEPPSDEKTSEGSCDVAGIFEMLAKILNASNRSQSTPATAATAAAASTATPENKVDCALARPFDDDMFSNDIRAIGQIIGTKAPTLDMRVRKSGRTTDYTEGVVEFLNSTINVAYNTSSGPRTARFVGQVFAKSMSKGGDSGALIVDATENKAVGLLFAGSSVSSIFTPIDRVLYELNVTF